MLVTSYSQVLAHGSLETGQFGGQSVSACLNIRECVSAIFAGEQDPLRRTLFVGQSHSRPTKRTSGPISDRSTDGTVVRRTSSGVLRTSCRRLPSPREGMG